MKNRIFFFLSWLITVMVVLSSCSGKLDQKEYVQYVKDYDHGHHVRKTQGDVIADVQYQPLEFMALQRVGSSLTPEQLKEISAENSTMQFYVLSLQYQNPQADFINAGVSNPVEQQQKLYYFSYGFQEHISLREQDGKEWPCVLYHFEKNAHVNGSRTFALGFENPLPASSAATLILRSAWLGDAPIEINISKEKIPSLKL